MQLPWYVPVQNKVSQSAFWHTSLQYPPTSVTLKRQAGSNNTLLIHWDDVSHHPHPHFWPEHCRLQHTLETGEEQNWLRDQSTAWNIYQSSKRSSESLLDDLDTCLKHLGSAYKETRSHGHFALLSLLKLFFFLGARMQEWEISSRSNKFLWTWRGINIQKANYIRLGKSKLQEEKSLHIFKLLNIKFNICFPQGHPTPGKGTLCNAQGWRLATLHTSAWLPFAPLFMFNPYSGPNYISFLSPDDPSPPEKGYQEKDTNGLTQEQQN